MTYNDRDYNAVYALNSYLFKVLEANLGWTKVDNGLPFYPTQQQPEAMQAGNTFIVYGSSNQFRPHYNGTRTESISYTVYSKSSTDANAVINLLVDCFERQDEAVADVNNHTDADPRNRKVSFGAINPKMTEHAEPADEEGGYVSSFILLEAIYTVSNDTAVFSGFTYP